MIGRSVPPVSNERALTLPRYTGLTQKVDNVKLGRTDISRVGATNCACARAYLVCKTTTLEFFHYGL